VFGIFTQVRDECLFRGIVHRARRFIEQQYVRFLDQRAGNGDRLALATGQPVAPFANNSFIAVRLLRDDPVEAGETRGLQDIVVVGVRVTKRNIVAQRALKQPRILCHVANLLTQIDRVELLDVDPVYPYRA